MPGPPRGGPHRSGPNRSAIFRTGTNGRPYVDFKSVDDLRRLMTPNGKIYSRKRLSLSARDQRLVAQALKRARYMALLPYTSATV